MHRLFIRYTYGKPVNGKVLLKLYTDDFGGWTHPNHREMQGHTLLRNSDMVNGIAKFDINAKELAQLLQNNFTPRNIKILATVEEVFTGVKLNEMGAFQLYHNQYKMSYVNPSEESTEDKEHELVFKITHVDGTLLKDSKTPVRVSNMDT